MLDLKSTIQLLEIYSNGLLPVQRLRDEYLKLFAVIEAGEIDKELFNILEDFFEDIDAYSPLWTSEDEAKYSYRITETTLRSEAQKSLTELKEYILKNPSILNT